MQFVKAVITLMKAQVFQGCPYLVCPISTKGFLVLYKSANFVWGVLHNLDLKTWQIEHFAC